MIRYVKGDLFDTECDIIAHGCNCRGGYGSGVAYTMAKKYPKARDMYLDKYDDEGWRLGDVQFVHTVSGKVIANCATQDAFLPRGVKHVDYKAIYFSMLKVKDFAKERGLSIAIPKIGAGLAGGDWQIIESTLEQVFSDYVVTVYYLD